MTGIHGLPLRSSDAESQAMSPCFVDWPAALTCGSETEPGFWISTETLPAKAGAPMARRKMHIFFIVSPLGLEWKAVGHNAARGQLFRVYSTGPKVKPPTTCSVIMARSSLIPDP